MEDHELKGPAHPSPWMPESNAANLKVLGKLGEELNEGGAAVSRCIIQGIDECEPVTGKLNRSWLEDEIADILANLDIAMDHFGLDRGRIALRADRKRDYIRAWLAPLADEDAAVMVAEPPPAPAPVTRDLVYRFFELRLSVKREICERLSLPIGPSNGPDWEQYKGAIIAASEQGKLIELAEAIRDAELAEFG